MKVLLLLLLLASNCFFDSSWKLWHSFEIFHWSSRVQGPFPRPIYQLKMQPDCHQWLSEIQAHVGLNGWPPVLLYPDYFSSYMLSIRLTMDWLSVDDFVDLRFYVLESRKYYPTLLKVMSHETTQQSHKQRFVSQALPSILVGVLTLVLGW